MGHSYERPTEPIRPAAWAATGATSAGGRPDNQDAFDCFVVLRGTASPLLTAVVADGVGGEQAGDLASLAAVAAVRRHIQQAAAAAASVPILLANALVTANSAVIEEVWHGHGAPDAASTMVLAAVADDVLYIAHLGDSRAYLVRQGQAFQLTRDHSAVQDDISAGRIAPTDAPAHPELHTITRFLGDPNGVQPDLEILHPADAAADAYSLRLESGDRIVLCTDGLTDVLSVHQIARIAGEGQPDKAAQLLLQKAIGQGTRDNVTAVLIAQAMQPSPARVRRVSGYALAGAMALLLVALAVAFAWSRSTPASGLQATQTPAAVSAGPTRSEQLQVALPQPTMTAVPATDVPPAPTATAAQPTVAATPTGTATSTGPATPMPGIEDADAQTAVLPAEVTPSGVPMATAPILQIATPPAAATAGTADASSAEPLTPPDPLPENAPPIVAEGEPITAPPQVTVPLSSLLPLTQTTLPTGTVPLTGTAPITNPAPTLTPGQLRIEPLGQAIKSDSRIEFVIPSGAVALPAQGCFYEIVLWDRTNAASPAALSESGDGANTYGLGAATQAANGDVRTILVIEQFMREQPSFRKNVDYCVGMRLVCQERPVAWYGPEAVCTCAPANSTGNCLKVGD